MNQPQVRPLGEGDEAALESFVRSRIDSSMFLASNLEQAGLVDEGLPYQGTYAAAFVEGRIVGVVAHYWNQMLVLQAPEYLKSLLPKVLETSDRQIRGLSGLRDQVLAASEILKFHKSQILLNDAEGLYSLMLDKMIVPEGLRTDQLSWRRILVADVDLVTDWRVAFSLESKVREVSVQLHEQIRARVEDGLRLGEIWILEKDGKAVASSGFNATYQDIVQIGGVWTPPSLRSRGYGRAVVAASLLESEADGVRKAILFTGDENIPAIKAYQALGFQRIGDFGLILLKELITPRL